MGDPRAERRAVVLGLDRTGLAIARALGRAGVEVTGVTWRPDDVGLLSRYVTDRRTVPAGGRERDEAMVEAVVDGSGKRPIVFPVEDDAIEVVLRRWEEVRAVADLPLPDDAATVQSLRRKELLPQTAKRAGVPGPATAQAPDEEAVLAAEVRPPLLVKPVEGNGFEASFGEKAFVARSLEEAAAGWARAHERGFETILQELIPDAHERIWSLFTYVSRTGAPLVSVTGRKVRQLPVGFGSSTVFEVAWEPRVHELGHRLLSSSGYRGFAHVEFAHDARDGEFKVIEVNTRPPVWASVAARGGPGDIARAAFADLSGAPPGAERVLKDGRMWVDFVRDVQLAVEKRERRPWQYAASYGRKKTHALYSRDDPLPVLGLVRKVGPRLRLWWQSR